MENGHAVIATSAQLKTPFSGSSPSIPQFFSLHFNPNQKINISPFHYSPSKLYSTHNPILLAHAPGPLYVVTLQRKQSYWMSWTSTANLIQASLLLRLHTMFTAALLIKNRQEKKKEQIHLYMHLRPKMTGRKCPTLDV